MNLPDRVQIVEVGPRDGLQNEPTPVPTSVKLAFIAKLVEAGLTQIEATSFVHPKLVPQLADAMEVAKGLAGLSATPSSSGVAPASSRSEPGSSVGPVSSGVAPVSNRCDDEKHVPLAGPAGIGSTLRPTGSHVTFSALVPNETGLQRALEAGMKRIAVFTAASETFVQKNIRMSIEQSLNTFEPIVRTALSRGVSVRGYVSTCFVCPFEGDVPKERVREVTERLLSMGVDEVAIGDTIGAASPKDVLETVGFVLDRIPREKIALHFHDTYGTALANVFAGLQLGITTFDSSAGGLGGCPFAPGAAGNLATEDLVYMLDRMGIETGVEVGKAVAAANVVADTLRCALPSRQSRRLRARC